MLVCVVPKVHVCICAYVHSQLCGCVCMCACLLVMFVYMCRCLSHYCVIDDDGVRLFILPYTAMTCGTLCVDSRSAVGLVVLCFRVECLC